MLLLTAPLQHIAENSAVEQDPRRVKLWLDELPIENVQTTVSELIATLKPFNELQIDIRSRIKLLEIYHRSFETIPIPMMTFIFVPCHLMWNKEENSLMI